MTAPTGSAELRRQYTEWARANIGGSESEIAAAARALMDAKVAGATAEQAIDAARAAARRAAQWPQPTSAPPGKVVGYARGVQPQRTEFQGVGGNSQVVDFDLECPGQGVFRVQLRGLRITGRVSENDEIVATEPSGGSRFIQAGSVFNRTTNSEVTAVYSAFGGPKDTRRAGKMLLLLWVAIPVVFLVIFIGFAACSFSGGGPPPEWCEQAVKSGMQNPPGC